jgi:hypothetical protein
MNLSNNKKYVTNHLLKVNAMDKIDYSFRRFVEVNSIDLSKSYCHRVHALIGRDKPLFLVVNDDGVINVNLRDDGELSEDDFNKFFGGDYDVMEKGIHFSDPTDSEIWLAKHEIIVPNQYLIDLRDGTLSSTTNTYEPTLDDIKQIDGLELFKITWDLSYEDTETINRDSFETLSEARKCLGETGALSAVPGNAASISIGSCRLFSSHFESSGFDRGDSHINPRTQTSATDLYYGLLDLEKKKEIELEMNKQKYLKLVSDCAQIEEEIDIDELEEYAERLRENEQHKKDQK